MVTTIAFMAVFLLFRGEVSCKVPDLAWAPAPQGDCSNMDATATILNVPITYEPSPTGQMGLYVKRYMTRGATTAQKHIVMLPGGPGQDERSLEGHASVIAEYLKGFKLALYLVDLRCVGQSGSFVRPNDIDWVNNRESLAAKSPVPLQAINLTNAARDVLQLAEAIRDSPEFTSGAELNIFGVSFGATWTYRVLQLDRVGLFKAALLDSVAPLDGLVSPEADEGLLRNCDGHPYCKAQFGGDSTSARTMLAEILNPTLNKCTEQLAQAFADPSIFNASYSPLMKFHILVQPALEGVIELGQRMHTAQLVLAFIKATHLCANPDAYRKMIDVMLEGGDPTKARAASLRLGDRYGPERLLSILRHSPLPARASDANDMNMLVNYLFFISEAYDLPRGGNGRCGPVTLSHQCALFGHYRTLYELLRQYVTPRPGDALAPFSTSANVYFVHGEVDMLTPVDPAMRFASNIQGKVRKLTYRNAGHAMVSGGDCAALIWQEVMAGASSQATDACMKASNSVPLDWTFKQQPAFQTWWDQSIPVQYVADPALPSTGGGLSMTITIIIAVSVIVLIGAGAGLYFKLRP